MKNYHRKQDNSRPCFVESSSLYTTVFQWWRAEGFEVSWERRAMLSSFLLQWLSRIPWSRHVTVVMPLVFIILECYHISLNPVFQFHTPVFPYFLYTVNLLVWLSRFYKLAWMIYILLFAFIGTFLLRYSVMRNLYKSLGAKKFLINSVSHSFRLSSLM